MDGANQNGLLRVRDVCELVGITPHTLRYWEKEFSDYLKPLRSAGGHRLYDDHNIRKILEIKHLLREKYFSIKGVKLYFQQQDKNQSKNKS